MTASFIIGDGDTINVAVAQHDSFNVTVQDPPGTNIVVIPGAQGAPGPAFDGTAWWYGEGQPATVIGSKRDDYYVDTLTGVVYRLE